MAVCTTTTLLLLPKVSNRHAFVGMVVVYLLIFPRTRAPDGRSLIFKVSPFHSFYSIVLVMAQELHKVELRL